MMMIMMVVVDNINNNNKDDNDDNIEDNQNQILFRMILPSSLCLSISIYSMSFYFCFDFVRFRTDLRYWCFCSLCLSSNDSVCRADWTVKANNKISAKREREREMRILLSGATKGNEIPIRFGVQQLLDLIRFFYGILFEWGQKKGMSFRTE